ncbi:MAG: hypothetical protein K5Q00_06335 [Gammaproteobacteria bacterium]|nr:hypothetical protein [Gammaproteobacteria bacterium]
MFFITCPKGLAPLLFDELTTMGITNTKASEAGVHLIGDVKDAYTVCLWSRLANRVLLQLDTVPASNANALYEGVKAIDWLQHLAADGSFVVDVNGTNEKLINSQFTAQKVKDAVVDLFQAKKHTRPNVDKDHPDLRINVLVKRDTAIISIDLSGESLHRRGYRMEGGMAPLKENLAAALLLRCQWPALAKSGAAFVDPLCGSGTLLFEALLMAANIAPGLLRQQFGFQGWLQHDADAWNTLRAHAETIREENLKGSLPPIIGFDQSTTAQALVAANAERLGVTQHITFQQESLAQIKNISGSEHGLIVTNPPYGERLTVNQTLYPLLAETLRAQFPGWQVGIFTGNPELCTRIGMKPVKKYKFLNGTIACLLLCYLLQPEYYVKNDS